MSEIEKASKAMIYAAQRFNEESARVKSAAAPDKKTVVEQEFNEEIKKHRLVLRTIVDGQIQAEVIGPWVPFMAVATVSDYRAFHPRYMIEGLPRLFKIIDCGNPSKDYIGTVVG